MSKHIGRKQRWTRHNPSEYVSQLGKVVYQQRAWYSVLEYRTAPVADPGAPLAAWQAQAVRLGPFKRPRNAMVALEREATVLQNRHGRGVLFQDPFGG
jgi:hypothetical protein